MTTGQRIKAVRKSIGITQDELGKKLSVSGSAIAQYETDNRKPKYETLQRIAEALNVPLSYFTEQKANCMAPNLQQYYLKKFLGILSDEISNANSTDMIEIFGTSHPYEDILDGPTLPLTLEKVQSIADELGIPLDYLTGFTDNSAEVALESCTDKDLKKIRTLFTTLNSEGKKKAVERIEELAEIPRYRRQLDPPAEAGNDTTPTEPQEDK